MAEQTVNYQLVKMAPEEFYDRTIDNENLDKIDRAIKEAKDAVSNINLTGIEQSIEDLREEVTTHLEQNATTTTKGHVQLSNDTNSTSETLAPTMKALNEVKQYANDIKTKWASVVGSPLVSSDTQAQLQSKTQTIKNTLASNLTAKGQTSVGTETLMDLVSKVANVNTGRKWASGTAVSSTSSASYKLGDDSVDNRPSLTISGLNFVPSLVIIMDITNRRMGVLSPITDGFSTSMYKLFNYVQSGSSTWTANFKCVTPAYVTQGGFQLPVTYANTSHNWIAYE